MALEEETFREALVGKKIPILTLDNQWHKLFTQTGDNDEIHDLEEKLNELLKRQGKLNTEVKSLSSYKKKLMQEIVSIMELPDSSAKEKKMDHKKETTLILSVVNDNLSCKFNIIRNLFLKKGLSRRFKIRSQHINP